MRRFLRRTWQNVTLIAVLVILQAIPVSLFAKSAVKIKTFSGAVDFSEGGVGPATFELEGNASHLGKFTSYGEVMFAPSEVEGSLIGTGVAVFEAANGDLLVGNVVWNIGAEGGDFRTSDIHFSWTDSITLADGTVVKNTGRFVKDRPPGLVVIAIIAILIGLLLPAVQKVR